MATRAVLAHTIPARLTLAMVSRSVLAGLLIFGLGSVSATARGQEQAIPPVHTTSSDGMPATATRKPASSSANASTAKNASAPNIPATNASANKATAKPHKTASKKGKKEQKPAEPVVQAPPPPPPTPEESPAAAPLVNYQDGQLSIRSENSTLGSILSAVKARTGASVDGPAISSSERIATQLGPGDPRDVLTTLLSSTKYDFMLVGSAGSPNSVQKIIVASRASSGAGSGGAAPAGGAHASQSFQAPTEQPDADQTLPDAEIPDDANQVVEEPPQPDRPEQPEQPEQAQPQPVQNGIGSQPPAAAPEGDQQNPNQAKSPEQLLQELQRMQQQQQQQQGQPQVPQHSEEPR